MRIDANLAGEYSGIMHFINGLERDKTFFVISAVTLTGQQGGLVNLRLRLNTYLHAADAKDLPPSSELTPKPDGDQSAPKPKAQPISPPCGSAPLTPAQPVAEVR